MSQTGPQARERAVQAITRRNMLEKRIRRTQRRVASFQGEARQALEDSLAADQEALSEAIPTVEAVKAIMRQAEDRRRWELQEELRHITWWRTSQYPPFPSGSNQWGPGQTFALVVTLAAVATMIAVLLLNR